MQIYLIYQVYNLKALKTHIDAILKVNTVTSFYCPHKQIKHVQDTVRNPICIPPPHFIIMLQLVFVKALYETLIHTPTSFFTLNCSRFKTRPDSPDDSTDAPTEGGSGISSFVHGAVPQKQNRLNSNSYFFYLGSLSLLLKAGAKEKRGLLEHPIASDLHFWRYPSK